jgi:hypothetical protein
MGEAKMDNQTEKTTGDYENPKPTPGVSFASIFTITGTGIILLIALAGDAAIWIATAKFSKIFAEMLEGEPLPTITRITFNAPPFYLGLDILLGIACVSLALARKNTQAAFLGIFIALFLCLKTLVSVLAFFMPLIVIVQKLGG